MTADKSPSIAQAFTSCDLRPPTQLATDHASVVVFSSQAIDKTTGNEDAAGYWELGPGISVLAVADGVGGCPGGAEAAATAIDAVGRFVTRSSSVDTLRSDIIDAFEDANRSLLEQGIGAATTLVVAEVQNECARTYHAGDSGAIIVGQRGRLHFDTIPHSPVGYAVASGILEQDDVHDHDERHLISNCLGSREMRVEIGAPVQLAVFDTLLLATDGVLDNIQRADLVDVIRRGSLIEQAAALQERVQATMSGDDRDLPAHPDDATAVLYRRSRQ